MSHWTAEQLKALIDKNPDLKKLNERSTPRATAQPQTKTRGVKKYKQRKDIREKEKSEHRTQSELFSWIRQNRNSISGLDCFFAVPNGGHRHEKVGWKMVKEGLETGVPDILGLSPSRGYHGMALEMKVKGNTPTKNQEKWLNKLVDNNYYVVVCWSEDVARSEILWYLGHEKDG